VSLCMCLCVYVSLSVCISQCACVSLLMYVTSPKFSKLICHKHSPHK